MAYWMLYEFSGSSGYLQILPNIPIILPVVWYHLLWACRFLQYIQYIIHAFVRYCKISTTVINFTVTIKWNVLQVECLQFYILAMNHWWDGSLLYYTKQKVFWLLGCKSSSFFVWYIIPCSCEESLFPWCETFLVCSMWKNFWCRFFFSQCATRLTLGLCGSILHVWAILAVLGQARTMVVILATH